MPALPSPLQLNTLIVRSNTTNATSNATTDALQVICAWPVSGQYGPGSRVLYYVLVAACVFARKAEWLRNACVAAALIFPAVAALHGIVLAALHIDGAVDMDVFGAFQLCSIGILAAPVTVRISKTYFYDPGRNTIFLWTGLVLAGLLSLTVEFYRINTSGCTADDNGVPISTHANAFPYGGATCGLTCSVDSGPISPMRGGSANNIYVIPAPNKLTFGTATLLAAACCIPAVLSLVFMWEKIVEINWKTRFGNGAEDQQSKEQTNAADDDTAAAMKGVNAMIRLFLSAVEVPVFGAAVFAIVAIGERNFFSPQVRYQTEPIATIGQWAPIVGTGIAVFGSLYLLLGADLEAMQKEAESQASLQHGNRSNHHHGEETHSTQLRSDSPSSRNVRRINGNLSQSPPRSSTGLPAMQEISPGLMTVSSHPVSTPEGSKRRASSPKGYGESWTENVASTSRPTPERDVGNRVKVAKTLTAIGTYITTAAHERFDVSDFKYGKAGEFPEIPGEANRSLALPQIKEQYHHLSRAASPRPPMSRSPSPLPSPTFPRALRVSTLPVELERHNPPSPSSPSTPRGRQQQRRATLEVPRPVHYSPTMNRPPISRIDSVATIPQDLNSPVIVVSSSVDTPSPAEPPILNPATSTLSSNLLAPAPAERGHENEPDEG